MMANAFLLVLAAIFPIVNPHGDCARLPGLDARRCAASAWEVARNAFVVLVCSVLGGALFFQFYGIVIPVLRTAGGIIVAFAGWRLRQEGGHKGVEDPNERDPRTSLVDLGQVALTSP